MYRRNPHPLQIPANPLQFDLGDGINLEMVNIPTGKFQMGTSTKEANIDYTEGPAHTVTIWNDFYICKFEVTQQQWAKIMGNNPSYNKGDSYPVENVSWNDVTNGFLAALNAKNLARGKFRLPTEAEWEYAERAGHSTRFYWGNTFSGDYAWYGENSGRKTHPAGQKLPNAFGLFDITGNVSELCSDWYEHDITDGPVTDPKGPDTGSMRVTRGGWCNCGDIFCRSASRGASNPESHLVDVGFRLILSISKPQERKKGFPKQ